MEPFNTVIKTFTGFGHVPVQMEYRKEHSNSYVYRFKCSVCGVRMGWTTILSDNFIDIRISHMVVRRIKLINKKAEIFDKENAKNNRHVLCTKYKNFI